MSDTKFTPGEWEVRVEQVEPTSSATTFTVATDYFDIVSCRLGIRNENDAHLISAAPDMYEALDMVNNSILECRNEIELADAVSSLSHNISQALKKARGEV